MLVPACREAQEDRRAAAGPRRAAGAPHSLIGTLHSCPIKPQPGDRARQGLAPGRGGVTRWDQPCNTGRWPGRGWGRLGVGLAAAPGHQPCWATLGRPPALSGPGFPRQVTAPLPWLPPAPHAPSPLTHSRWGRPTPALRLRGQGQGRPSTRGGSLNSLTGPLGPGPGTQ